MSRITVQAGFGYAAVDPDIVWSDITQWTDIKAGITITRGASDELQQTQTGTCSLVLDDSDGRFTPGRTTSPYYPHVKKRVPIRVLKTTLAGSNFVTNPGFEGPMIAGWDDGPQATHFFGADELPAIVRTHSGTCACLIQWATIGTGGIVQTTLYGLTIGETYTASAYVYVEAANPAVRLQIDSATLGGLSAVTDDWTRISVTWTATTASHDLQVTTGTTSPGAGTQCWLDDVQAWEGAAPVGYDGNGARVHDRFYGPVASWQVKHRGLQALAPVTASDLFAWMSRQPLQPMLIEEVLHRDPRLFLHTDPALYYPLSEPSDSVSAGDLSGNARTSLMPVQVGSGGALTFGQGVGPPSDGLGCPLFAPTSSTAGIYLAADIGRPLTTADSPGYHYLECWFATTVKGRVMLHAATTDPAAFETSIRIGLDVTSGHLKIDTSAGGIAGTSTAATANLADGLTHHLLYDEFGQKVYVDGVGYSVAVDQMTGLRLIRVGGYGGTQLWDGSIAHVTLYAAPLVTFLDTDQLLTHYVTGTTANAGEGADERIMRLAGYVGVLNVIGAGTFSPIAGQGQLGSTALSHMREVETTEGGKLLCDRGSAALVIQARTIRYNPGSALSIAWADTQTDEAGWADDDQKITNIVLASRPGGATQRVADPASVAAYGPYQPAEVSFLKTTDAEVLDAATWTVQRYADPPPEMRQLTVEVATMPVDQHRVLLDADTSSVITVTGLPDEDPAPTAVVMVEGYTETITENQHVIAFHTSRADLAAVWALDDPVYSVLGSTTRLAY